MKNATIDVKTKILDAAVMILQENNDTDNITSRQIAEKAKVGIGSINYHFQSKDNLLSAAIGKILQTTLSDYSAFEKDTSITLKTKLKSVLKSLCNIVAEYEKLSRFLLTQDVLNGNMQTMFYVIPILKDIFKGQKSEMELRIIAMQILQPLQIAGISTDAFRMYSGVNMYNVNERNDFIDMLVDNLIE